MSKTSIERYRDYAREGLGGDVGALLVVADAVLGDEGERGWITLGPGVTELTVQTRHEPVKVYLSLTAGGLPVCGGGVDTAGCTLGPTGFTIYANVVSESCRVDYISER